jgi:hypothetical protein
MTVELHGTLAAGTLVVTGTDLTGKSVSLSKPVPAGAFLSAPGIGGSIHLIEKLARMKPGAKRTLTSLALDDFPVVGIVSTRYEVERRRDAGGHRVFAVAATQRGTTVRGDLVVDDAGFVVAQSFGPPISTTITRRSR